MGTVREALHNVLEEASNNEWSEFDLAAACYAELRRYVVSDSLFLASYTQPAHMQITGDGVPSQNPNLAQLEDLRSSFARTLIDMRNGRLRRADAYQAMWKGCESISLIPFINDQLSESTLLWTIIQAVDQLAVLDEHFESADYHGPMNELACKDRVGVYTSRQIGRTSPTLFDDMRITHIPEQHFNDQLDSLVFIERHGSAPLPNLVTIRSADANYNSEIGSIRIGLEFFTGANIYGTDESNTLVRIHPGPANSFTITYGEGYDSHFTSLVHQSIRGAINHRCDILVFPEILISPKLLQEIRTYLKRPEVRDRLKLVVAGSTWYHDIQEHAGQNVSTILNGRGSILGTTHKRDPFIYKMKRGTAKLALTEAIFDTECKRTVVDVSGIGRIAVSICKDTVSDDRESIDLVRDIKANIMLVPAFSDSIQRGFYLPFTVLAERGLAVACLSNYCGACIAHEKDSSKVEIGYVFAPEAGEGNPRQAHSNPITFYRNEECKRQCIDEFKSGNPQSCLHVVEIRKDDEDAGLTIEQIA